MAVFCHGVSRPCPADRKDRPFRRPARDQPGRGAGLEPGRIVAPGPGGDQHHPAILVARLLEGADRRRPSPTRGPRPPASGHVSLGVALLPGPGSDAGTVAGGPRRGGPGGDGPGRGLVDRAVGAHPGGGVGLLSCRRGHVQSPGLSLCSCGLDLLPGLRRDRLPAAVDVESAAPIGRDGGARVLRSPARTGGPARYLDLCCHGRGGGHGGGLPLRGPVPGRAGRHPRPTSGGRVGGSRNVRLGTLCPAGAGLAAAPGLVRVRRPEHLRRLDVRLLHRTRDSRRLRSPGNHHRRVPATLERLPVARLVPAGHRPDLQAADPHQGAHPVGQRPRPGAVAGAGSGSCFSDRRRGDLVGVRPRHPRDRLAGAVDRPDGNRLPPHPGVLLERTHVRPVGR